MAMALSIMLMTAWSPFLSAVSDDASSCDEVVTVISVENGEPSVYTGEEAKQFLVEQRLLDAEIEQSTARNLHQSFLRSAVLQEEIQPNNAYGFRYVYEETEYALSRVPVSDKADQQRICKFKLSESNGNAFLLSCTQEFTINAGITGEWLKAVKAELGASWTNSVSASSSYNITIAPGKKMWLEFTPRMNQSYGAVRKYLTTTGPKPLIETKMVNTYSPIFIYSASMETNAPDGIYTFKEAKAS